MSDPQENVVVNWDMSRERLVSLGAYWLLPTDDSLHPWFGMTKRQIRRWRRSERRTRGIR